MKKMDTYMATFNDMNQTFTDLFTSMQEISGKLDTVIKGLNLETVAPAGSKPEPSKIAMANIDVEKEVEKYTKEHVQWKEISSLDEKVVSKFPKRIVERILKVVKEVEPNGNDNVKKRV